MTQLLELGSFYQDSPKLNTPDKTTLYSASAFPTACLKFIPLLELVLVSQSQVP